MCMRIQSFKIGWQNLNSPVVENNEIKINMFKELITSFKNQDADSLDECCEYSLAYRLAWQDLKNST